MNTKKHILFLVPGFPKDEDDFNTIPPLQEFLKKFISIYPAVKISVITFQYPYIKNNYSWNGLQIIPVNGQNRFIKKPFVWLSTIRESKRINREFPVTTVHSLWLGECALIGTYLSKKFGCHHLCTLMGQDVKVSNKYLGRLKDTTTKFIALSKNQAEQFHMITSRKVNTTIHWGIDDQIILSQERDIDLLGVGSLIPLKNYSLFINTIAAIVKKKPDLRCKLVGTGPELSKLKDMSNVRGLIKNIEFTGLLSRSEIFRIMQRSKILVHPSLFEGSGFVFAEALANGMNIVSFNVGYAHEHTKWMIAKDENEFINYTEKLINDHLNFDPVNLFPLKQTVDRYAELYGI